MQLVTHSIGDCLERFWCKVDRNELKFFEGVEIIIIDFLRGCVTGTLKKK